MTAKEILAITKVGDLFSNDRTKAKNEYRELAKQWHPDVNPDGLEVFKHIKYLYSLAEKLFDKGEWEKSNCISIKRKDGTKLILNYLTSFEFELGICYVGKTKITYILNKDKKKFYDNAVKQIKSLKYGNKEMEDKIKIVMPSIYKTFETAKNEYVLILNKSEDVYPLKYILDFCKGKIDDKHVAWIISRLCNIACYLQWAGLVHNGICLNNCFISPQSHSILLLGGWWYTTKGNDKMIGTTKEVYSTMTVIAKDEKISRAVTDLESIKLLGRKLLGESDARKLAELSYPKPLIEFLCGGSRKSALTEFSKWDKALEDAFGKRRFIKWDITESNIYERKEK